MTQLDLRAELDVTRQQTNQRRMRERSQVAQKIPHTGAHFALAVRHDLIEPERILFEEPFEIIRRWRDAVRGEEFPDKTEIRAPGEFEFLESVASIERLVEHNRERFHARAMRADQRAVDIK